MSNLIRLAEGQINPNTFMSTDSYLITNWTRTSDMSASIDWVATEPLQGMIRPHVASLEVGAGNFYGRYAGVLEFFQLTPQMRDYIEGTILNNKGIGQVTVYMHKPQDQFEMAVFYGQMISPFRTDNGEYERFDDFGYYNVRYLINRATEQSVTVLGYSASGLINIDNLGGNTFISV